MPGLTNCTLNDYQLEVILENEKTKARKWVDICRDLKVTPNKLYANLIYLGLRCQKSKIKTNEEYFSWEEAKKQDYIFTIKDSH